MTSSPRTGTPSITIPAAGHYTIDRSRSAITFRTRHMFGLGAVSGSFALSSGEIDVRDPVTRSTVVAEIAADSFTTGNSTRDNAVHSRQYLDVANHPTIRFASKDLTESGGSWTLGGTLLVRHVERPVQLAIEHCEVDGGTLTARATTRIDRKEFDITAQPGMTGRYLDLTLDVVAARADQ